jgi:hypothetical protein
MGDPPFAGGCVAVGVVGSDVKPPLTDGSVADGVVYSGLTVGKTLPRGLSPKTPNTHKAETIAAMSITIVSPSSIHIPIFLSLTS